MNLKEISTIILASLVLALTVSFKQTEMLLYASISFLIIISLNILVKKGIGYYFESNVDTKFWSWYQWGFRKDSHFKKPLPMVWLPLILALFTRGLFWWLPILEFDVSPRVERASRRHGLYRFTQVTEWHMGIIAMWGIFTSLILATIGYLLGFEIFAKYSIFYAVWSIVPLSNLDGSKIFFASRGLWITTLAVIIFFLLAGLMI